jgi:NTP pyrophosphatase (non-canonical NTP hydrolase)
MMTAKGLAKLAEELGELQQVVGKMLAYGMGAHPDGTESLLAKFEEESADVAAALTFVSQQHGADSEKVKARAARKLALFQEWHSDPSISSPYFQQEPSHDR